MVASFQVEAARLDELRAAFALMYHHIEEPMREHLVSGAMQMIRKGEMALENLLVVRDGGEVGGVIVWSVNPGAAGQLWPPQVISRLPAKDIEDALMHAALHQLRQRSVRFVQTLLTSEEASLTPPLQRAGFSFISRLLTLSHPLTTSGDLASAANKLQLDLRTYPNSDSRLFADVLLQTYEGTVDFPELNGLRSATEIVAAHRNHGDFDPEQWYLAYYDDKPVGVLLLVKTPDLPEWELSYVGLVPAARSIGIGRELVNFAVLKARKLGASQLTVSVDARNFTARRLYLSLGFQPLEEHQVYLFVP